MSPHRWFIRCGAALVLLVNTTESMAAVAPGVRVRVTTTRGTGFTVDRVEGRLVSAADPLTLVKTFSEDTLSIAHERIAKLEAGESVNARRSVAGTLVGAVLVGGLASAVAFYKGLDENSFLARSRYGTEMMIGIGAAGMLVGGYVVGARHGTTLEWREVPKRDLAAPE